VSVPIELREDGPLLVSEPVENVLQVSLNRPERVNALTPDLLDRLSALLDAVAGDPRVRAIVLTGAGAGFCAGFDLDAMTQTWSMGLPELLHEQEGWAATAAASFGAAFVRVGLSGADLGLSWSLPRVVGMGFAAEIMLTGRQVPGAEAYRIGLVNRLCEEHTMLPTALDLAGAIAANSPFGVRLTKRVLHAGVDAPSFAAAAEIENRNQILASRTEDMAEALHALRERRTPTFRNR
jgi:enoyl-CoA hydratase